jgi:hypothetical protein
MQIVMKPYAWPILNRVELVSLVTTSVTIYLAAFYTVPYEFSRGFLMAVTVVMIAVNVGVMAWFGLAIVRAGAKSFLKQIGAMHADEEEVRCCAAACR